MKLRQLAYDPSRWWAWLVAAFVIWALEWARAAGNGQYVVHVTIGRIFGSFAAQALFVGFPVFRAGVLYGENRRRLGKSNPFVRERPPQPRSDLP